MTTSDTSTGKPVTTSDSGAGRPAASDSGAGRPAAGTAQASGEYNDERLAWEAVRGELDRRSRRNPLAALMTVAVSAEAGAPISNTWNDLRTSRMALYWSAVTAVTERMTPRERARLRRTGAVPDWFLAAVLRRYAELQRLHAVPPA